MYKAVQEGKNLMHCHFNVPLRTKQEMEQNSMIPVQCSLQLVPVCNFNSLQVFDPQYRGANRHLIQMKLFLRTKINSPDYIILQTQDCIIAKMPLLCLILICPFVYFVRLSIGTQHLIPFDQSPWRNSLTNHHHDLNQAIMFPVEIASEMLRDQSHFNVHVP
jgi:hypothetical protein